MSAYVLGNLFGRLFMSALIVFVVMLIFKRFKAVEAFGSMKSPWSILSVLFIFVLGLASSTHIA